MSGHKRPTLRDVALVLRLSVTQTSRALNGHTDVAPATRKRAKEAAEQLGYIPNLEARRLKIPATRTHSIGLVMAGTQRMSDPFFGSLVATIIDEAAAHRYELQLSAPIDDEHATDSYRRAILGKRVDGFIVLRTTHDDPRARYLADSTFPFVTFGRVADVPCPAVAESPDCLRPAVDHLVGCGHRRIGCLIEPPEHAIGTGRHRSFLQAMAAAGLTPPDDNVVVAGFRDDTAFEAAGQLLDLPDRPTALVTTNDLQALGAMRAAAARGIDVPNELSIIGFDDIDAARFTTPPLTTLRHRKGLVGRQLVNQLLAAIDDPSAADEVGTVELQPELVLRGSVAPPPDPDSG